MIAASGGVPQAAGEEPWVARKLFSSNSCVSIAAPGMTAQRLLLCCTLDNLVANFEKV